MPRIQALLDVQREAADRNVFVFVGQQIGAAQRARAPNHAADDRKRAQAVDAERIEHAVLVVGQAHGQALSAAQRRVDAGGRLPDAALRVGARHDAGDASARNERVELALPVRIRLDDAREVERGVARGIPGQSEVGQRLGIVRGNGAGAAPGGRRIDDQHRAARDAERERALPHRRSVYRHRAYPEECRAD